MNYLNTENYQKVNEDLSQQISDKYNFPIKVRAYENCLMAGYDVCFGLLQFLSHKPKIGIVRLGSSLQESLLPQFYRLQIPIVFKKENENFVQFTSSFDHEMNFVLWSSENEITGEILISNEKKTEIHKLLSSKRVFSIEVKSSINAQDIENLKQNPYSVLVEAGTLFSKEQCLVYHSDKLKTPSLIGHYQNNLEIFKNFSFKENLIQKNTEIIAQFKTSNLNYFNRFAVHPPQLNDRLVVFSKTVSGSHLKSELGLNNQQAFAPSELPLWVIEAIPFWWPDAKAPETVMGLLVISLNEKADAQLIKKIHETHDKLSLVSNWSIS